MTKAILLFITLVCMRDHYCIWTSIAEASLLKIKMQNNMIQRSPPSKGCFLSESNDM